MKQQTNMAFLSFVNLCLILSDIRVFGMSPTNLIPVGVDGVFLAEEHERRPDDSVGKWILKYSS